MRSSGSLSLRTHTLKAIATIEKSRQGCSPVNMAQMHTPREYRSCGRAVQQAATSKVSQSNKQITQFN